MLPDVVCDWRHVTLTELPATNQGTHSNRVKVEGAKGKAPSRFFKVSVTAFDGFR